MEQVLAQFIDKLVEEKGLANLEPDVLAEIKTDLGARVEDRINAALLEAMPKDKLDAFEKLLDSGSPEEAQAFCREHIPNIDEVAAETLLDFRRTYLNI
ncbi:MAG: DUF5663 domain-containing protein [Minisyncoccia bacterium]